MPFRTFLALDISDAVRKGLSTTVRSLPQGDAVANWVKPENLHVTLNFLGDVPDARLAEVCDAVAEAARMIEQFDFDIRGLRCVPAGPKGKIIWADVTDPAGKMTDLHRVLTGAMAELDFAPDRRGFNGHVTVARIKRPGEAGPLRAAAAELGDMDFGSHRATEVVVYTSVLSAGGPIYASAARCPLA